MSKFLTLAMALLLAVASWSARPAGELPLFDKICHTNPVLERGLGPEIVTKGYSIQALGRYDRDGRPMTYYESWTSGRSGEVTWCRFRVGEAVEAKKTGVRDIVLEKILFGVETWEAKRIVRCGNPTAITFYLWKVKPVAASKNGLNGKNGRNGHDGKPGPKGDRGETGRPGRDGVDGKDGAQGEQGPPGPPAEVYYPPQTPLPPVLTNESYAPEFRVNYGSSEFRQGLQIFGAIAIVPTPAPGKDGLNGQNGKNGLNGNNGNNGLNGLPGPAGPQGPAGPCGPVGPTYCPPLPIGTTPPQPNL
ncbi:MAG: hypothetical protein WCI57_01185 [Candidatus Berkelbacteria bacterium]